VFERFTVQAREVVVLAQDEARNFGHASVDTEHLLVGLLRQETGAAATALERLDVTAREVRREIERIVGRGDTSPPDPTPFARDAKKALELSLREALSLGANVVSTEHVLLGVVRVDDGIAARILRDLGADPDTIRAELLRQLERPPLHPAEKSLAPAEAEARPQRGQAPELLLAFGWALFAIACGIGLLAGWLIWG
jgi:ATP-dependent Clp protease ATP-binding subunit ClpC